MQSIKHLWHLQCVLSNLCWCIPDPTIGAVPGSVSGAFSGLVLPGRRDHPTKSFPLWLFQVQPFYIGLTILLLLLLLFLLLLILYFIDFKLLLSVFSTFCRRQCYISILDRLFYSAFNNYYYYHSSYKHHIPSICIKNILSKKIKKGKKLELIFERNH